jgi:Mg2+/Co2+ transporter CorB
MATLTVAIAGAGVVCLLLVVSAFFSSSETAVFTFDPRDIEARTGEPAVDRLLALRDDPHRLLVTLLVGNNVVNAAIASVLTVVVTAFVPAGLGVVLATGVASVVVLVFGEIVPKAYGLGNAEQWSLRVARPIGIVAFLLTPVVVLFDGLTRPINAALGGDHDIEEPYTETEPSPGRDRSEPGE